MASWLKQQRKIELNSLADEAGIKGASGMRKDDLVDNLDKHLQANSTKLSSNSAFDGYYKPEPISESESKAIAKARATGRRVTKAASEILSETSPERAANAIATRTPRSVSRAISRLPPSPSAVTDLVERQTTFVTERVSYYWDQAGVTYYAETLRETLSSVVGIQTLFIVFEAYGLSRAVLPTRHAFTVPGFKFITSLPVSLPDFFLMLTSDFWGPTTVWAFTSIILPVAFAWFFNLTLHASKRKSYAVDPLIFSITKALTAWLVYSQGFNFAGWVSMATILRVNAAVPGGWFGIVIGSVVGIIASVYEAALKK